MARGTPGRTPPDARLTRAKVGLVLAALLAVSDLASLLSIPDSDEPGPPAAVLIAGAAYGVITLVAVVYTWRTGNRIGARVVAGSRILSMIGHFRPSSSPTYLTSAPSPVGPS
ncbi:hypothetical protein [Cryptosporangium sp. NPDC048952]|uniref:hypothetical protein n=1 Tax=Cryptosporangium sp. NPDC048952 TaxID=3363961 RepID=UPI00371ACC26